MISVDRFQAGSNLTPEYIDKLARAIKELQGLAVTGVQWPLSRSSAGTLSSLPGEAIVQVKNNSGTARSKFDVLVLGDPIVLPTVNLTAFDSRVAFNGGTPSEDDENLTLPFAILLEPAETGAIAKAMIQGVTPCRVYVSADAEDSMRAGLADESYALTAGAKGAKILWKENGTGTKRAVVALGFGGDEELGYWARITDSAYEGDNKYAYGHEEVYKSDEGYSVLGVSSAWTAVAGGRSGTSTTNPFTSPARNSIEDRNSAAAVLGIGVDPTRVNYGPYRFEMQPCPAGTIVWMREVPVGSGVEYWFSYENGVDGECI